MVLTADALGFYQLAFRLSNVPATEIVKVISTVAFPEYATLQEDLPRLHPTFLNTLELTLYLMIPMTTGIFLILREFTVIILGPQWEPIVLPVQIVILAGFARGVAATGGALFQGTGAPEWDFRMNLVRLMIILISIWPLTSKFGIAGTAASITLGIGGTIQSGCTKLLISSTRRFARISLEPLFQ